MSPTWDESMVFEEILVYGRREDIEANPPIIIVETYDQDKVWSEDKLVTLKEIRTEEPINLP